MKLSLSGFLNQELLDFNDYITKIKELNLNQICLSHYNKKTIDLVDDGEVRDILTTLKNEKLKVLLIKSSHKWDNITNDMEFIESLEIYKNVLKVATKLKATGIIFKAPFIDDAVKEHEVVVEKIKQFYDLAIKSKLDFYLEPHPNQQTNSYTYLFKKNKWDNIKFVFIPEYMLKNNESSTTNYRVIKPYMGLLYVNDFDFTYKPQLLGLGKTDILNLLKRIKRDEINMIFLIDNKFEETYFLAPPKMSLLKRIFKKKDNSKEELEQITNKIFSGENKKNVTYHDILENQIKVIEKIIH